MLWSGVTYSHSMTPLVSERTSTIELKTLGDFYVPTIRRMVERAYSVTHVHTSPSASGVSNLSFSGGGIVVLWTHF